MKKIVRQLRGGRLTIPAEFRSQLGIDEDTLLEVTPDEGELRIRPIRAPQGVGGSPWARELHEIFAPVRKGMAKRSKEEIDGDIDKAVAEVRRRRS